MNSIAQWVRKRKRIVYRLVLMVAFLSIIGNYRVTLLTSGLRETIVLDEFSTNQFRSNYRVIFSYSANNSGDVAILRRNRLGMWHMQSRSSRFYFKRYNVWYCDNLRYNTAVFSTKALDNRLHNKLQGDVWFEIEPGIYVRIFMPQERAYSAVFHFVATSAECFATLGTISEMMSAAADMASNWVYATSGNMQYIFGLTCEDDESGNEAP